MIAPDASVMIDIIIPNWNGEKYLPTCLESLRAQTTTNFTIYVVDNGSEDGSVQLLKSDYPEVVLIEHPHNTGFSRAVNSGIHASSNPWIFLLNNDVEVAPDCIEHLSSFISSELNYQIVALKMMDFNKREFIDGAGDAVLRGGVGYRIGTMEKDKNEYAVKKQVFGACAGAALYKREVFQRIGFFDDDFFAYLEDVDLNFRAVRAGFKACFLPDAVIYHIGSASTGSKFNATTIRLSTRNNLLVMIKNYDPILFIQLLLPILVYQFFWLIFIAKHQLYGAYIKGIFEALKMYPLMRIKKSYRHPSVRLSRAEFRQKITNAEYEAINSVMRRRKENGKNNLLLKVYRRLFFMGAQ